MAGQILVYGFLDRSSGP